MHLYSRFLATVVLRKMYFVLNILFQNDNLGPVYSPITAARPGSVTMLIYSFFFFFNLVYAVLESVISSKFTNAYTIVEEEDRNTSDPLVTVKPLFYASVITRNSRLSLC